MDSDVIKAFNKSLVSIQECKGSIVSKQKVIEITKAAMNAVRYFKHVVFIIERYLARCRQEFKIPALYIMDSVLRQAKKQYKHKDVYAPRFAVNLTNTISNVLDCESNERLKVVRVVNLWLAHQIFSDDVIEPVLRHCKASGLEIDMGRVERLVKGEKADMQLYQQQPGSAEKSTTPSYHGITNPITPITSAGPPAFVRSTSTNSITSGSQQQQSLDERLSLFSRQKLGLGRSNSSHTTPRTTESGPKTPPLEDQDHRISTGQIPPPELNSEHSSSTCMDGLSSTEVIQLFMNTNINLNNVDAIQRVQSFLNERIKEQLEIERRRQGNIKNILSRDFDYSDEEDDDKQIAQNHNNNGGFGLKNTSPTLTNVSHEKLLNIAKSLTTDPATQNEIQKLAIGLQSPTKLPFTMPDFSVPPPNMTTANVGAAGTTMPGLFMPLANVNNSNIFQQAQQQQPSGTSFLPATNSFTIPPPTLYTVPPPTATQFSTTIPVQQYGDEQRMLEESFTERHKRDRDRDRDDNYEHRERRDSRSNGRKRTREWTPNVDDKESRSRHVEMASSSKSSSRRHRDERKRSRSRSIGTPPRHRDRDKENERNERKKEREREQQERDRRRIGLPSRPKSDHVLIASRTLWFGRIPALTSEQDIHDAVKEIGIPERVAIVGNRGCAYVTMADRKSAYKILDRLAKKIQVLKKNVKLDWATIPAVKDDQKLQDYWDMKNGVAEIPFSKLPDGTVDKLMEGAWLDLDTLPTLLKDRYTNTGLKHLQQIQLPSTGGITLPSQPTAGTTTLFAPGTTNPAMAAATMMPGMFNLNVSAMFPQMTGLIGQIPPPTITATQGVNAGMIPAQITTALGGTAHFNAFTAQSNQAGVGQFANAGFANSGFGGKDSGRGGGYRGRGGRGRGDFNNQHGVYRGRGGNFYGRGRGRGGRGAFNNDWRQPQSHGFGGPSSFSGANLSFGGENMSASAVATQHSESEGVPGDDHFKKDTITEAGTISGEQQQQENSAMANTTFEGTESAKDFKSGGFDRADNNDAGEGTRGFDGAQQYMQQPSEAESDAPPGLD